MSKALILIGSYARDRFREGRCSGAYKEIKLAWQVGTDSVGRL